jgi:hypothetical protein
VSEVAEVVAQTILIASKVIAISRAMSNVKRSVVGQFEIGLTAADAESAEGAQRVDHSTLCDVSASSASLR